MGGVSEFLLYNFVRRGGGAGRGGGRSIVSKYLIKLVITRYSTDVVLLFDVNCSTVLIIA